MAQVLVGEVLLAPLLILGTLGDGSPPATSPSAPSYLPAANLPGGGVRMASRRQAISNGRQCPHFDATPPGSPRFMGKSSSRKTKCFLTFPG